MTIPRPVIALSTVPLVLLLIVIMLRLPFSFAEAVYGSLLGSAAIEHPISTVVLLAAFGGIIALAVRRSDVVRQRVAFASTALVSAALPTSLLLAAATPDVHLWERFLHAETFSRMAVESVGIVLLWVATGVFPPRTSGAATFHAVGVVAAGVLFSGQGPSFSGM